MEEVLIPVGDRPRLDGCVGNEVAWLAAVLWRNAQKNSSQTVKETRIRIEGAAVLETACCEKQVERKGGSKSYGAICVINVSFLRIH